jgi:hypothetical protein
MIRHTWPATGQLLGGRVIQNFRGGEVWGKSSLVVKLVVYIYIVLK